MNEDKNNNNQSDGGGNGNGKGDGKGRKGGDRKPQDSLKTMSNESENVMFGVMLALIVIGILNVVGYYLNQRGSSQHPELSTILCPTCP